MDFQGCARSDQKEWRNNWFMNSLERLKDCDLVFADPDNGLKRRETFRPGQRKHAKSIPECEARTLADGGRPVVIYHHNTRYRCGHDAEIRHWQKRLGEKTCAVRWRHRSPRTFFILNCTDRLAQRAEQWCEKWESPNVCFETPWPATAPESSLNARDVDDTFARSGPAEIWQKRILNVVIRQ